MSRFLRRQNKHGDQIVASAHRELLEETGLIGDPKLAQIVHYRVYTKPDNPSLLEDKIMFLFRILNPNGELIPQNPEGKYDWVKEENIDTFVTNPFESLASLHAQLVLLKDLTKPLEVVELDHFNDKY